MGTFKIGDVVRIAKPLPDYTLGEWATVDSVGSQTVGVVTSDGLSGCVEPDYLELVTAVEIKLGRIREWTHLHGAALKPGAGSSDTFGDGMREAKRQVASLLDI